MIDYAYGQAKGRMEELREGKRIDGRVDFLSHIVVAEDKKTELKPTLADLGTEGLNMINAGADPYSSILAAALFYLCHNPETLAKVTQEIR